MLPAFIPILGAAISSVAPGTDASPQLSASPGIKTGPTATNGLPPPPLFLKKGERAQEPCQPQDTRSIVVCAQRRDGYRLDPNVMEAKREKETNNRSANSKVPTAEAVCSAQPMGCGKGMQSLDLANMAIVLGTTAIRAAKGEDWTRALKTGGAGEYQLYKQAEQRRKAQDAERAAARMRTIAREEERRASAVHRPSQ